MENYIRNAHERVDNLHVKNYRIIQNSKHFCYGIDAVLLSYYAHGKMSMHKSNKIIDLGTGTGIIPILLCAMDNKKVIDGLEIQKYFVDMANRSIQMNYLEKNISIYHGDLKDLPKEISPNTYHIVVSNPPYMMEGDGIVSENPYKAIARHEVSCTLDNVLEAAKNLLVDKGKIIMIHRADRLVDIFCKMRSNDFEPKSLCFVYPKEMGYPRFVLIEGIKNGNPQLNYEPSIIIYNEDGTYTDQIKKIYGYL